MPPAPTPSFTLRCRYFIFTYPAVPFIFYALTLLCPYFIFAYPAVAFIFYALTLLCPHFIFTYPAVPSFFYTLTLLCDYPPLYAQHYPAVPPASRLPLALLCGSALFFYALTLLCLYFSTPLPLSCFTLTLPCLILLCPYLTTPPHVPRPTPEIQLAQHILR